MSKLKMKSLFKSKSRLHRSTTDLAEWTKNDDKLMKAVEKEDVKRVTSLLSKKSLIPTKLGHQGSSVFHVACAVGNVQIVEVLLKETICVNDLTIQGNSALLLASAKGRTATVLKLLEASAEVDLRDGNEMTALHHACAGLHLPCVKVLLGGRANPHITDKGGKTPLFYAVHRGGIDICRCLIEKGADVNTKDLFSTTPLMIAAKEGHKNVCEFLLRRGAGPELTDRDGHTATDYASSSGHAHLLEVFANPPDTLLVSRHSTTASDSGSHVSSDLGSRKQEVTPNLRGEPVLQIDNLASDDEASQADVMSVHSMDDTLMAKSHHSVHITPLMAKAQDSVHSSPPLSKMEMVLTELQTEHDQLNKDYKNLSIENLRLRDKNESLQMKLNEKQSQEITTLPPHIQKEIQKMKTELDEEKQKNRFEELSHSETEFSSEQSSGVSKQTMETDSGASSTVSDWVESGEKSIERMQTLQSQVSNFKQENEKLKTNNIKLREELTQVQEESARNLLTGSEDVEELLLKNGEKAKEVESLKKQIETLETKLTNQSESQRLDHLIAGSHSFEEEVEFDEEGFVQGRDMTKEEFLQGQNQQLKTQCGLLTTELEKLRSQFYAILEAGDQLQADYDQQAADKDALHDQVEAALKEKAEIVSENEFLLSDNNALHEDLKKLVHELEKIQGKFQKSQTENEELKRSVNVASKVGEVARLLEERDILQLKYDEMEKTSKTMQTDHSFLLEEVQSMTESYAQLTVERDQLVGEVEEMTPVCQQLETLQQDYNQLEQDFGELLKEKEALELECAGRSKTELEGGQSKEESIQLQNGDVQNSLEWNKEEVGTVMHPRKSSESSNNNQSNCLNLESIEMDEGSSSFESKYQEQKDSKMDVKKEEEIVRLKKKIAHLTRELTAFEQKHEETVTTYRTHLLSAVQGHMDPDVKDALYHIIELRSMEQFC